MEIRNLNVQTNKGKTILHNINLSANKGELLAIMGPSGSGKTTMLDIFTQNFSNLVYNGTLQKKGLVKYVSQEDHLHGFYTVRQYLEHYISLNYQGLTDKEKERIILASTECTGLTSALNTIVGDLFRKGLSGGQKRRLSITLELISKPDILVLDEPTSGLDSVSAFRIIEVLKKLTEQGLCVVCTLHQPSSQIWNMLDKVMLLSKGYTCYSGPPHGAQVFFDSIGKMIPAANFNPADFFIFQINSDFDSGINPIELHEKYIGWSSKINLQNPEEAGVKQRAIAAKERVSTEGEEAMQVKEGGDSKLSEALTVVRGPANGLRKILSLCHRNLLNTVKNPGIIGIRLVMYTMLSFMIGFMYFDLGSNFNHSDIISRTSLLFYVDAFLVFMSIAVLPFFMIERGIISKEVKNKLYSPVHYQIARFVTSLPGVAAIALVSSLLVNLVANLNGFGVFLAFLFMSLVIAESLAMLVSLVVPHYIVGMALIAGLYGTFMLCQGFLIVKDDIPGYFIWVYYMAFHTYSFQGFMYNEFHSISSFTSSEFSSGEAVLSAYSMESVELWKNSVILVSYSILLEIIIAVVFMIMFRKRTMGSRARSKVIKSAM